MPSRPRRPYRRVGGTAFGGPGDPGTGHIGASGVDLNRHPWSFAELSKGYHTWDALGKLPMGARMLVRNPKTGKAVVLVKRDVGQGGSPIPGVGPRKIDLWYQAAKAIGFNGWGPLQITRTNLPPGPVNGRVPRPGRQPRRGRTPGVPGTPGLPAIPGVPGTTLSDPTPFLQSLGDQVGVPWNLPPPPGLNLPGIPGIPGVPGKPGKPGQPSKPGRPGAPTSTTKVRGKYVLPVPTKMGGSDFSYVDAEGAPDRHGVRHHAAHDWFGKEGGLTPVFAPVSGKIIESKQATTWSGQVMGGTIKVLAPNGMVFVFRHVIPGLKVGQRVKSGSQIARIGRWTDGPDHTHVEIWKTLAGGYNYENMIDPVAFFGKR